ncbi:MAG: DEAD/DEAH box helicase [Opitutus sp.]|nr:DEAD/DEAH box helicase [Opitutus sp.]
MLRFHLPPNLAAAAARDAVALRVELNLTTVPPPELLPALALLQRWSGTPTPPKFIQLSRSQLRALAAALDDLPVFIENGQPTAWHHDALIIAPPTTATPSPLSENRFEHRERPVRSKIENAPSASPLTVDGSEHFLAITLPSRESLAYASLVDLLKTHGFTLEPSNRKWWLRDRHKTLNFLATHGTRLRETLDVEFTPNFEKNTAHLLEAEIATEVAETGGEFAVTLGLRAGSADESALRSAVASNRGYLEADGKIFLLAAAKLQQLATAQRALAGDPAAALAPRRTQRVSVARVAEAQDILAELSPAFQPPEAWRTRSAALRNLSALTPAPLPAAIDAQLRPYQRLGAAWLWHLHRHQLGGILADEMGLGKTLQALALLSSFGNRHSPIGNPSLVIAPASLLENWRREAARFTPQLRVFVHHADHRLASPADFAAHDLVITSYGTLARDQELFTAVEFACVIGDEAQHIKNRRSQNAAALRALRARTRFLLTGTPLENSLDDLRSLFEFLLPGYLTRVPTGVRGEERAWFNQRLRAQTAPYILRRTKRAVAPELPEKLEQTVWCEMTPVQAALYRTTQEKSERELFDLEAGGASETKLQFAALTQLLRLRQICCDPRLIEAGRVIPNAPSSENPADLERRVEVNPPYPRPQTPNPEPSNFADSAKLDAFREILAEALDDGHRLLVFSQFTSLLALLRADLNEQGIAHCYLDGSMTTPARQVQVDRFQNISAPDAPAVFLLSLKAGGTGLNLTAADTVIHFDPWWNPATEAQATDRAHRIGQTRIVTSYKLVASGTVEEKVLALQDEKRALLADVFEASAAAAAKLSLADLKSLLAP